MEGGTILQLKNLLNYTNVLCAQKSECYWWFRSGRTLWSHHCNCNGMLWDGVPWWQAEPRSGTKQSWVTRQEREETSFVRVGWQMVMKYTNITLPSEKCSKSAASIDNVCQGISLTRSAVWRFEDTVRGGRGGGWWHACATVLEIYAACFQGRQSNQLLYWSMAQNHLFLSQTLTQQLIWSLVPKAGLALIFHVIYIWSLFIVPVKLLSHHWEPKGHCSCRTLYGPTNECHPPIW